MRSCQCGVNLALAGVLTLYPKNGVFVYTPVLVPDEKISGCIRARRLAPGTAVVRLSLLIQVRHNTGVVA